MCFSVVAYSIELRNYPTFSKLAGIFENRILRLSESILSYCFKLLYVVVGHWDSLCFQN